MIIEKFTHYPGVHCESTAIRDLLAFEGLHFSEPMIFGLGSGLNFIGSGLFLLARKILQ